MTAQDRTRERSGIVAEFDAKAEVYDTYRLADWYRAHNDAIAERLRPGPGESVLDVGCATGYLIRRVLTACPDALGVGVDVAPRMVEVARTHAAEGGLERARFFCADWEFPDVALLDDLAGRRIAYAACASVFHYFSDPASALRLIAEVLAPGGALYLLERRKENSLPTRAWDMLHRRVVRDHVRFYETAELLDMLRGAGFRDARVETRIARLFWKNKLSTSLSLIRATR